MARNIYRPVSQQDKAVSLRLQMFLEEQCLRAGVDRKGPFNLRIAKLLKRSMSRDEAWEWLVSTYSEAHPNEWFRAHRRTKQTITIREVAERENRRMFEKVAAKKMRASKARDKTEQAREFYSSPGWRRLRYEVLAESDGRCECCGRSREHGVILHVDHIKPRSKHPHLALEKTNCQCLCEDCNLGKSNRDERDWRNREPLDAI